MPRLSSASREKTQAYRSSMLKAFKKTLDEGVFSLVIVDDRNLRVADFAQFWATAKDVYMYFRGSGKAAEMKREAAKRTMMAALP